MSGFATGFEGSYLGSDAKISLDAVMECKICWTPYEPALGDETRSIQPGTAFRDLPDDWKCPTCDAPKAQFMVVDDPGQHAPGAEPRAPEASRMQARVEALEAEFREILNAKMRGTPFCNAALHVEAISFRLWQGHYLGVLVTPWFMNLTLLPGEDDDWSALRTGEKELIGFPSGRYEFIHAQKPPLGAWKSCSLFSPMGDFASQLQASDVGRAVMIELFNEKNRAETDRSATIRAARESAMETGRDEEGVEHPMSADAVDRAGLPTRRKLITGQG